MSSMPSVLRTEVAPLFEALPELAGPDPSLHVSPPQPENYHDARDRAIGRFEVEYLSCLLAFTDGNMTAAARIAGVDRTTLYRLMDRHGLRRPPRPARATRSVALVDTEQTPPPLRIELP